MLERVLSFFIDVSGAQGGSIFLSASSPQEITLGSMPRQARKALQSEEAPAQEDQNEQLLSLPLGAGEKALGRIGLLLPPDQTLKPKERDLLRRWSQELGTLAWLVMELSEIETQREQLAQRLKEEQNRILRAQEDVRRELARELHDGLVQRLSTLAMGLEYVRQLYRARPEAVPDEIESLRSLALRASQEARMLLFELRPLVLERDGLAAALEAYLDQMPTERAKFHVDVASFSRRLILEKEEAIFDIVQEAVTNARKHAQAENISLHLREEDGQLVCVVEDDGRGFDVKQTERAYDRRVHFGLINTLERAEMIGGYVTVESVPGEGTKVTLRVPISKP